MAILVSDSFNRADNATTLGTTDSYNGGISKTWQYQGTSIWGISSNQAYWVSGGNSDKAVTYVDAGVSDVTYTLTIANYSGSPLIALRYNNTDKSYLSLQISANRIDLYDFNGVGTWTSVGSKVITRTSTGDTYQVILSGNSITVNRNGTLMFTSTSSRNQISTLFGFEAQSVSANKFDNLIIEDVATGGTVLRLSLSDSIILGESFTNVRNGKIALTDSITATDSITIKSTRFLSLIDSITTSESFTKRRQAYLSLADGLTIGDTETSTRATINTLVRALSDSINITDSITIRAMRYLTMFDLFLIVDSLNTTGGGNVAQTIKFKRGNEVDLPTLAEGEPAVTLDTNKMFVGTPNGNRQIATLLVVDSVANLPVADQSKQFLISGVLGGTGVADALYVCKKLSNDTYDWVQFV